MRHMEDDILERDATFLPQLIVLLVAPVVKLHDANVALCVRFGNDCGHRDGESVSIDRGLLRRRLLLVGLSSRWRKAAWVDEAVRWIYGGGGTAW